MVRASPSAVKQGLVNTRRDWGQTVLSDIRPSRRYMHHHRMCKVIVQCDHS